MAPVICKSDVYYPTAPDLSDVFPTGKLMVTVISARGIDEIHSLGNAHPYAMVTLGGTKYGQTGTTHADKGREPVWNHTFSFHIKCHSEEYNDLGIKIYNEHHLRKDNILGAISMRGMFKYLKGHGDKVEADWYPIFYDGSIRGMSMGQTNDVIHAMNHVQDVSVAATVVIGKVHRIHLNFAEIGNQNSSLPPYEAPPPMDNSEHKEDMQILSAKEIEDGKGELQTELVKGLPAEELGQGTEERLTEPVINVHPAIRCLIDGTTCAVSEQNVIRVGKEILLQAFNWESHKYTWWKTLQSKIPQIAAAGFTCLWLPPSYDSLSPEGYLPRDLYSLNTVYGTEDELRTLIHTIKQHNIKPMADIVINHRIGSTKGIGGIYNRYDGMPMPWDEHAVTCDTGGLGNPSTGAIFDGAPNIDHTQGFVRRDLKEWLRWMLNDLGFNSFRFDFAKGYSAEFVKEYLEASNPEFAVGEFWDSCSYTPPDFALDYNQDAHRQRTVDWVDGTSGLACAFDFTTKAILQEAVAKKEWWRLRDPKDNASGVLGMWPSRAVTFIENHDTGSTQGQWPFPSDHVLQGYAYILTHPGQPTVFYDHFFDWGESIRGAILDLIVIRKRSALHSRSSLNILEANSDVYAASIDGKVSMKLGDGNWDPGWGWNLSTSGQSYAVWERHTWPEGQEPKL